MRRDTREVLIEELSSYPAFAACSPEDLGALAAAGEDYLLTRSWSVLQQGVPADSLYIIRSGEAHVFDGRRQIATLRRGDLLGEAALFGPGRRNATVTTVDGLRALRISYRDLARLLRSHPALSRAIEAVYASRAGAMDSGLDDGSDASTHTDYETASSALGARGAMES